MHVLHTLDGAACTSKCSPLHEREKVQSIGADSSRVENLVRHRPRHCSMGMPGETGSTFAVTGTGLGVGLSYSNASTFRSIARASIEAATNLETLLASTTSRGTKSLRTSDGCSYVSILTGGDVVPSF